ncbi:YiiX/YebB-like N1pC/P60 family cysteine hydrolase [Chryseobacterium sp. Leaf394]|uniref:YiiX/YebB-like N1pC/P60 family cysteine hydrolase n=1 Tax=Chryseobacterium sp. Leaf394 TaxID=1736361 RepID=UPI0009E6F133|nr:YiiX/YebB-like N1pC/P60 family cysteine hydrolase [Chryseobacterium sp. Leaf394]
MRKIFNVRLFAFLIIILSLSSCASGIKSDLKNGDLLFVTAKNSGLSGAINNVTQKKETEKYDHIGILEIKNGQYSVLHASPNLGSNRQNLNDFINDQKKDQQNIVVYRLKPEFQEKIPNALAMADLMLGKPYNFNYILDENSYYCSDFIERAFRENQIFKLEPMTFIDPKTRKTNEFWQDFYNKKNLKVPEGELGCNPNGLAGSDKLIRIKVL